MSALGVRIAEALLGFECRDAVAAQQLLLVVFIPLELRQPPAAPTRRPTSRVQSPDVSRSVSVMPSHTLRVPYIPEIYKSV